MFTKDALPREGTTADSKSAARQFISAANRLQGTFDVDANGVAAASAAGGFTVTTKSGEVWQYGATPDSLILAVVNPQVRVWALSSITDRNGNSVRYGYTQTPLLADGSRGSSDAGA